MLHDRLTLRRHWLAFALLALLSAWGDLFLGEGRYRSLGEHYQLVARHNWRVSLGAACFFGPMIAATYFPRKLLWWVAICFISYKLSRLLEYYAFVDYAGDSTIFNHTYWRFPYLISRRTSKWLMLPGELLFGNNALSAAFLTTLYVYWLTLCRKLLHAPTPIES